jgi:ATP-dependent DNA helicase RecG
MSEFPVKPVNTRGRYYLQSLQLSWDSYEARGYTADQLDPAKIQRFIRLVNQHGRFALDEADPLAALQKLNYLKNGQPTWAAVLLFAKEPIRHNVHIGRFKTPDMIIDDRQFTDTLFEVVDQSMKFIVSYISVAFEFDGSIQRKERFAYPLPAVREALLNAIVHRSYTDPNDIQTRYLTTRSPFSAQAPSTAGSPWQRFRPTTIAPACATNLLPKAST